MSARSSLFPHFAPLLRPLPAALIVIAIIPAGDARADSATRVLKNGNGKYDEAKDFSYTCIYTRGLCVKLDDAGVALPFRR